MFNRKYFGGIWAFVAWIIVVVNMTIKDDFSTNSMMVACTATIISAFWSMTAWIKEGSK